MWNIIFLITGAIFIALLLVIIFSKKVINSKENKLFKILIIINLIEYLIEMPLQLFVRRLGIQFLFVDIFSKLFLIAIFTWFSFFSIYTFVICLDEKKKSKYEKNFSLIRTINLIIWLIGSILLMCIPFEKFYELDKMYIYGGAVDVLKIFLGIYMIVWICLLLKNIRNIRNKKYAPIFFVLILLGLNVVIQSLDPSVLISTVIGTFICYLMSFTIENPDMKMLKEIQQSKEFAEQSNNEKAMFLYNMSQEIKLPVKSIEEKCEEIMSSYELSDELREEIREVKFAAKKLSGTINGTLDMSKTQASSIEIKVSKYNSKMLFKELVSISRVNMKDKSLDFRINIDDAIPEYLMGDSIRLKQIITTIMNNAIKHTEKGFIEFNVSSVIKHDMCRLIMTIEDSGKGIESHKLETLFYNTADEDNEDLDNTKVDDTRQSLSVVKILTNLIGGTVIVNSELGKGSKFTVVLDQKIVEEKTSTMIAIEKLSSNKRILVVDDEEESLNKIVKVLNKYDVNVDTVMWGQECLEKIRKKQKYDLILMDEDMPRLNGIKTFEKLKLEEGFNTPVVIMIDSKHLDYKERYLYNGFSNCVVKPFKKQDIDKIIKKHLKLDE